MQRLLAVADRRIAVEEYLPSHPHPARERNRRGVEQHHVNGIGSEMSRARAGNIQSNGVSIRLGRGEDSNASI